MKTKMMMSGGVIMVMAAPLFFWSGAAFAQGATPAEAGAAVPAPIESSGQEDENHISIGAGGAYIPAYLGSDKYRFQPLPVIDIKQGRFFVNFEDGIGANLFESETVTAGVGLTFVPGFRKQDAPSGIGRLSAGLGARGFVKLRQFGFETTLGTTKIITGNSKGVLVDASLSYPIRVSDRLVLSPSIGTTYGDKKHNNRYFGVNAQQSLASALPRYRAGSGFIDATASLSAQYRLTDRIGVGVAGGVTTLLGDAKNSPIVKRKTQPFGMGFISYTF